MKRTIAILIILSLLLTLASCGEELSGILEGASELTPKEPVYTADPSEQHESYAHLTDTGKNIYNALLGEVKNGSYACTVTNVDYDTYGGEVKAAVYALAYDHPEHLLLSGGYTVSGITTPISGFDTVKIELDLYDVAADTAALQDKLSEITDGASGLSSDFEKAKYAHDYIVLNTEYDHESAAASVGEDEAIYTAYGALVNGKAVCAGYAKAYQLILRQFGIPCEYISGDAGGPHAWCAVTLDGEKYLVDPTWDDADFSGEGEGGSYVRYNYFCLTSEQLTKTHTPSGDPFPAPVCTGQKYNYFRYYGYTMDEYDPRGFADIVKKQAGEDAVCVRFDTAEALADAVDNLITRHGWQDLPEFEGRDSISYSADEDSLILTFYK